MSPDARSLVLLALSTACTRQHNVPTLLPSSASDTAVAELRDGRVMTVRAARTAEGVRWVAEGAAPDGTLVDPAGMHSYTKISRVRGALEGAAIAGVGGAALGVMAGFASGDDECPDGRSCFFLFTAGDKAKILGLGLAGFGSIAGGLIGLAVGSRDVYSTQPAYVPRLSPVIAPDGGGAHMAWSF
jgi:hypothetical protein